MGKRSKALQRRGPNREIKAVQRGGFFAARYYQGPLPPPEAIEQYSRIDPTFPNRLLSLVESQSAHRIASEGAVIKNQIERSRQGMWCGFALGVLGLASATAIAYFGHPGAAGTIGGVTLVGLVSVFVIGKTEQSRDLSAKREVVEPR